MKTTLIIVIILLIGVFNQASVTHKEVLMFHKLEEIPIESVASKRVKNQLFILQNNMKKYDRALKRKMLKDSNVIIIADTNNVK
jgi:predicted metallopeptidase